jgi:hypothetical protein
MPVDREPQISLLAKLKFGSYAISAFTRVFAAL